MTGSIRRPIVEWLDQNGVGPDYADDAEITVDWDSDTITVEMFARGCDGGFLIHGGGETLTELVTFPMRVQPPAGLLSSYERLRARLREERSLKAQIQREEFDRIMFELNRAGHLDAAQYLIDTMRRVSPLPRRRMLTHRALAGILGRPSVNGLILDPHCKFELADGAPAYQYGGSENDYVGRIIGCDVVGDELYVTVSVLADVHAELVAGTKRLSLDVWPMVPETGQPDEKAFVGVPWAGIRIMSAMLAEPSSWPWPERKDDADVRP